MPSNYFSRLGVSIRRSVVGKEGRIRDSAEVLIGQGKLWFGSSKFFHSVHSSYCVEVQLLVWPDVALASSSELGGKRRTLSVVDTLSRTFSVPSVSGPSFQVCGYHIGSTLAGPDQFSSGTRFQIKTMAAHLPRILVGESYLDNLTLKGSRRSLSTKNSSSICLSTSLRNRGKVSMRLKNHQQPDNTAIYGYLIYNAAKTWCNSHPYMQSGSGDFHTLSSSCYSVGPAHDVPFDTSAHEEQLSSSADPSEQYVISLWCSPF